MLLKMAASVIVVLFEGHLCVEAARGRWLCHEEVSKNEVLLAKHRCPKRHGCIARWIDTSKLRLVRISPHLCQDELRCSERRDDVFLHTQQGLVGLREARLALEVLLVAIIVDPLGDVIGDLNADAVLLLGIIQCHVPCWRQLAADLGMQTHLLVVFQALGVNVPHWFHTNLFEVAFNDHDVMLAAFIVGTTSRDNCKEKLLLWHNVLELC
mmetsp:Transcript_8925/g.15761  ORF Transcript_8925/g.15761 Transcript_8925/m.15761 type:complete len:211 (+) Transcript_8925:616-1248(+)